jgi:hypothetical protein
MALFEFLINVGWRMGPGHGPGAITSSIVNIRQHGECSWVYIDLIDNNSVNVKIKRRAFQNAGAEKFNL